MEMTSVMERKQKDGTQKARIIPVVREKGHQKQDNEMEMISLIRYQGQYWVTLGEYHMTRSLGRDYKDYPSLKASLHMHIKKYFPTGKYQAHKGLNHIKEIAQENIDNSMYYGELDGKSRIGLIHISILESLEAAFPVRGSYRETMDIFRTDLYKKLVEEQENKSVAKQLSGVESVREEMEKRGMQAKEGESTPLREKKRVINKDRSRILEEAVVAPAINQDRDTNTDRDTKVGEQEREPVTEYRTEYDTLMERKNLFLEELNKQLSKEETILQSQQDKVTQLQQAITSLESLTFSSPAGVV